MTVSVQYLTGATVWVRDGDVRVVPWRRLFGNIEAGRLGCVPAPDLGWTRYVEADA